MVHYGDDRRQEKPPMFSLDPYVQLALGLSTTADRLTEHGVEEDQFLTWLDLITDEANERLFEPATEPMNLKQRLWIAYLLGVGSNLKV